MKNRLPVIYFARLFFVSLLHDPWRSSDGLSEIGITARHIQNSGRFLCWTLAGTPNMRSRVTNLSQFVSNFPPSPFPLKMKENLDVYGLLCLLCFHYRTQSSTHSCGCCPMKFTCCVFASCTQIFAASGEKNKIVPSSPSFIEAWCRRNYSLSFSLLMFERIAGRGDISSTLNTWWGGCN